MEELFTQLEPPIKTKLAEALSAIDLATEICTPEASASIPKAGDFLAKTLADAALAFTKAVGEFKVALNEGPFDQVLNFCLSKSKFTLFSRAR